MPPDIYMPSFQDLTFESIAIVALDVDRCADWYKNIFGFIPVESGKFENKVDGRNYTATYHILEGLSMRLEIIGPALNLSSPEIPPDNFRTTGFKGLVFRTSDIVSTSDMLEKSGVNLIWRDNPISDKVMSTLISDSEGNLINILQWQKG